MWNIAYFVWEMFYNDLMKIAAVCKKLNTYIVRAQLDSEWQDDVKITSQH